MLFTEKMKDILGFMLHLCFTISMARITDHYEGAIEEVQAVVGNVAELPCDLSVIVGDKIRLVLWSRNSTVIYSLDSRDKYIDEAQHWSNEQLLGGRAYFRTSTSPPTLIIENVKETDAGLYKCRLDFKRSPTVHRNVNLTIIIPPQKVVVVDERGIEINSLIIGPYNEGSSLRLTCISTGGWPTPKLSWWRENALLDDSWEVSSEQLVRTIVSNTLTIEKLQRSDLNARLTCQASNSNISIPISRTVSLDMSFRPLDVRILEGRQPLSADVMYTFKCQSFGARPAAVISWWRGTSRLKSHREVTSNDGNLTTSTLNFVPTLEDIGKYLSCRTENPLIPGSAMEDGWKMNIHYIPQANLQLGSTLNSTQIKEGADVYFECSIKANPWITKVSWRHNGRGLTHNATGGIIISNQSLVLQSISRKHAGLYNCIGTNKEGDGTSNTVFLNVKYAPICKSNQQTVYGIARQESVKITCDVDSNPEDGLAFKWKFNNSAESIDIQQSHYLIDKTRSTLTYKPMTDLDYGTVLCWASHEQIGGQQVPCIFHIIPAGKPDPVNNCSIVNQTFDSFSVSCVEGFNGGLQQTFSLELLDFHSHFVIKNLSSSNPQFNLKNLESGSSFIVRVYAFNTKGKSDTQVLQASTIKAAEKQTGMTANASPLRPAFLNNAPIFAVLIGIVATLIIVAIVIVIVLRSKGHTGEDKRIHSRNNATLSKPVPEQTLTFQLKELSQDLETDDKNPDVIPHSQEVDGVDPDEKVFLERLQNTSRFYETIPRAVRAASISRPEDLTSSEFINNMNHSTFRNVREEITYAELSLPNSPAYQQGTLRKPNHHQLPPHPEPIIYAQIDPMQVAQCQCSPSTSSASTAPLVGVTEQQTQTIGAYPPSSLQLNSHHRPQSNTTEVDMCCTPLLSTMHPLHPHRESTVETYIRHRTSESPHVVYTTSEGVNMRF